MKCQVKALTTLFLLRHIMYHVGHCEAIFRENGIKPNEYLDYFG